MAKAVIERLKQGYECVVAPYEADAQMAYLVRNSFVDGVITEDSRKAALRKSAFFKMDNDGRRTGDSIRRRRRQPRTLLRGVHSRSILGDVRDERVRFSLAAYVGIKRAHGLIRRFRTHLQGTAIFASKERRCRGGTRRGSRTPPDIQTPVGLLLLET